MENKEIASPEEAKKKKVSFSQFSNWFNCRHRWYLDMVKNLRTFEDSVNTCFGTAIHEAVQLYVETLYTKGVKEADSIELHDVFQKAFKRELDGAVEKSKEQQKPFSYTPEEYNEFVNDGTNILDSFLNVTNRMKIFPSNKFEFVAVEDEIKMPIKNNVEFIAYIDLILKEKQTGRYKIIDIKTSTQGWNQYQKEDPAKISQLFLYKAFFSRKYGVPIDMIDVEFLILRRRLYEGVSFPQSRIQPFTPKHTQRHVTNTVNIFAEFVTECFKPDGTYNEDASVYLKNPGKNKKHCRWCPHKKINCDAKSDIKDEE